MIAATRAVDFDFFSPKSFLLPAAQVFALSIDRSIATPITNLHDGPASPRPRPPPSVHTCGTLVTLHKD